MELGRSEKTRIRLRPAPTGSCWVHLSGPFVTGWAGAFCQGLSLLGASVLRGYAERTHHRLWTAEFEVAPAAAGVDVARIDYGALLVAMSPRPTRQPVLERFAVDAEDTSLVVEVEGLDSVGFLGALLARFAGLSLFPEEMAIDTRQNLAIDRFVLKGIGGARPSFHAFRALRALLQDLVPPARNAD